MTKRSLATACILCSFAIAALGQEVPQEYRDVVNALGRKGDYKDNVLKINIPRDDVKVAVDGISTPTPFGFGGWLSMTKGSGGHDVMMGDLVLLQEEVNPVMSAMLSNGLEVTALHNHFFFDEPRMFYMHLMGHGTAQDLTRRVKPGLDLIGKVARHELSGTSSRSMSEGVAAKLDSAKIAQIVGCPATIRIPG